MASDSPIAMFPRPDVIGYVNEQIGRGAAIGAIYPRVPPVEEAIDGMCLALARKVLKCKPRNRLATPPYDAWFRSAFNLMEMGQPPLPQGYGADINVDRLIRWLEHTCERILIGVNERLDGQALRDMRSVAEWMNRASRLQAAVVYGEPSAKRKRKAPARFRSSLEETLAKRLARDPDLRGLFEPNVLILTVFQTNPCADFVWRNGRLIVEIDSYRYHSGPDAFTGDRQRDYETGATGYVTLRLTDQEVTSDLELAVQKIRRFVQIRKNIIHV